MSKRFRRPWDEAMTSEMRLVVWKRRTDPEGEQVKVRTMKRGQERVNHYPFAKMLIGDFFIVALGSRSRNSMITAFRQAAARFDIEIAIHPWTVDGGPGFRVTKVLEGIKALKAKASKLRNMEIPASDGKWLDRRREYRRGQRVEAGGVPVSASAPSRPVVDVGATPAAPLGYDRSERLREAQAKARAALGLEDEEEDYFA